MEGEVQAGQVWKSKYDYPDYGRYIIKVMNVYKDPNLGTLVDVEFTREGWASKRRSADTMNIRTILEGYELVE